MVLVQFESAKSHELAISKCRPYIWEQCFDFVSSLCGHGWLWLLVWLWMSFLLRGVDARFLEAQLSSMAEAVDSVMTVLNP